MELIKTKRENGSSRVAVRSSAPSMTEQSHKKACNINTIMAKIRKGHAVPMSPGEPIFGDFTKCNDFQTAQNAVLEAHDRFMSLPSDVRRRFGNQPNNLLEFLEDPANLEEAVELGLVTKLAPQDPPAEETPPAAEETPNTGD